MGGVGRGPGGEPGTTEILWDEEQLGWVGWGEAWDGGLGPGI